MENITIGKLLSFEEYIKYSLKEYQDGFKSIDDMEVLKTWGYEMCYHFTPNDSTELYVSVKFEELLDRLDIYLYDY